MAQQLWSISSLGGYFTNNQLSKKVRNAAQPLMKFRQFVDAEPAAGRNRGDKVFFDKISNISTAGGTLAETDTIPKRNFVIRQGTLTLGEYGNSIPFTLKVQTLGDISVSDNIKTVLRDDMAKVLDSAVAAIFMATDYVATIVNTASTTFNTTGTATYSSTGNMSDKNVRDIIDQMKKLNIPRYDGGDYICIASTNAVRGLYDFFEPKAIQTSGKILASGEIGSYYGCRFVEETNYLSNARGVGPTVGEAVFFGSDSVREGIAIPEDIRIAIPTDYGRDQGIAWYYLGGFTETWDYSGDTECRIISMRSAGTT